ncbi:LexA family protein [Dyadobacter sediminis]|uniref:Translesion error-prone DNA polymerase V autoproteolytic subunit n=1 Tax=Dyadobacter sediminis TaxID=1493691 RepID=A0A5R9KB31_9BACT|nr:translesion error-prone DNA polymerase V autoproteolytic subunit [Dyadobacter sediminis]TLU91975.1 translesion error-prone DNA polymerase V autoproteolytic subunit [Dyadobacter sediminis]GGB98590.1 SOS-response transcriptional regulator UmuD-like protein [Dyadobacter sediminis]
MKTPTLYSTQNLDILSYCILDVVLPLIPGISAGFPSPAADFIDTNIDLGKELIRNPSSTFLGRVKGDSMKDAGIHDKDLLIIDKSLDCKDGKIAVCFLDGEFTVKRVRIEKDICWLVAENPHYKPIKVTAENDFLIWGIVIHIIKPV